MQQFCRRSLARLTGTAIALAAPLAIAQDGPSPVRMDEDRMAGIGLTPASTAAFEEIIVEGELEFRVASLFEGEELSISVFESTPGKTDHRERPVPYDEFVLVLSGKLILTEPDGTAHEFTPGDTVVVPLGYTGTWEMQGNYRELAIIAQGD